MAVVAVFAGCDVRAVGTSMIDVPVVISVSQVDVSGFVQDGLDAEVFVVPDPVYDLWLFLDVVQYLFCVRGSFGCPSGTREFVFAVIGLFAVVAVRGGGRFLTYRPFSIPCCF